MTPHQTPYEIIRYRKPSLEYFRVFGCKVFTLNTKVHLTKFYIKSYEGVFLRYSQTSKAYIVLNKDTIRIEESFNVTFDESFPEPKSSPSVEDDRIIELVVQDLVRSLSLEANASEPGYPKSVKETKDRPIEQLIGKKRTRLQLYTKDEEEKGTQTLETASKLLVTLSEHLRHGIRKFETTPGLNRHSEALEDLDPSPPGSIEVNLFLKHKLVSRTYSKKYVIMVWIFSSKSKSFMTMLIPPQGEPSIKRLLAFVDYASSRIDKAGGKWYTFKPEQNNLGDTYNLSWKIHLTLGLVSNFIVSQDAGLSKFEADFKQQQCEMTNKIDIVLKAINDQIIGILPSDTVKNPKLNANSTSPVLFVRSYPTEDPQCSSHIHGLINAIIMCFEQPNKYYNDQPQDHDTIAKECKTLEEEGKKKKGNPENLTT
uniref:Retrovirus-related Pol polyprotein from transposon TNT 1-94 n=1 Tax=Tanacetum cinerariifolium TaxID=118510 RepID=A0A699JJN3_TANCI|nr:retrovirus-related Pol polyprotein from transposon TNT 1-94 [Tanacetum cinerariifolium]